MERWKIVKSEEVEFRNGLNILIFNKKFYAKT